MSDKSFFVNAANYLGVSLCGYAIRYSKTQNWLGCALGAMYRSAFAFAFSSRSCCTLMALVVLSHVMATLLALEEWKAFVTRKLFHGGIPHEDLTRTADRNTSLLSNMYRKCIFLEGKANWLAE